MAMNKIVFLFQILVFTCLTANAQGDTVQVIPVNPSVKDSIRIVTYKCIFDATIFKVVEDTVVFEVRTNSMIDALCAPYFDTVNIGILYAGEWTLKYYYIDEALSMEDSVIYSRTVSFSISNSTGFSSNREKEAWHIYPIPAQEMLFIESPDFISSNYCATKISIFDLTGKKLKSMFLTMDRASIYIGDLVKGEYILEISINSEMITRLLIKE